MAVIKNSEEHKQGKPQTLDTILLTDHALDNRVPPPPLLELETINHYCFGGHQDMTKNMHILVISPENSHANSALAQQLVNTEATVINWKMPPPHIHAYQASFDYIYCEGFLDREEQPQEQLKKLCQLLRPGGAIGLVVNGCYGQYPVQAMRDLMHTLIRAEGTKEEEIALCQQAFCALGPYCWTRVGIHDLPADVISFSHPELTYQTFMGESQQSFTIDSLYAMLDEVGLHLIDFDRYTRPYYQPFFAYGSQAFRSLVDRLPPRDQHTAAEAYWGNIATHRLMISTQSQANASFDDLQLIPMFNPHTHKTSIDWQSILLKAGDVLTLNLDIAGRQISRRLPISPIVRHLLHNIDNKQTLESLITQAMQAIPNLGSFAEVAQHCTQFLKQLQFHDAILLRHATSPPLAHWKHQNKGVIA